MRPSRLLAEFVGTMILSLGIALRDGSPIAAGASLWAAIIGTGFISGAQFNPAITTACLLVAIYKKNVTKEEILEQLVYFLCHFTGATAGALFSWAIKGDTFVISPVEEAGHAYLAEAVATTSLILVAMIGGELRDSFFIGTLAVSITLYAGIFTTGPISGGCLNPAIGLSMGWTDAMNYGYFRTNHLYIYIVGPLTASVLAAGLYLIIHPELQYVYNLKDKAGAFEGTSATLLRSY